MQPESATGEGDPLAAAYDLLVRGLVREARAAFTKLSKLDSLAPAERGAAYAGLARACIEQDDLEQALVNARRSSELGNPEGFETLGETHRRLGDDAAAAEAFFRAYVLAPFDWTRLAAYCELTNRSHRKPAQGGHVPPSNPLSRLWLYQDLERLLEGIDCEHTFERTLAGARDRGIDEVELFRFLNARDLWCDCDAAGAWARADTAAERLWVAGWCDASAVQSLVAGRVLRTVEAHEKPDRQIEPPANSEDLREAGVSLRVSDPPAAGLLPPQLVRGVGLGSTLERARSGLVAGQRLVLLVGFIDTKEVPVLVVVTPERVEIQEPRRFMGAIASPAEARRLEELTKRLRRYRPRRIETPWDIPTVADQNWLRQALHDLVTREGARPFLRDPVRPADALERWRPDAGGMSELIRYLMAHAGLGHLKVELVVGRPADLPGNAPLGWFSGIEADAARFGCDIELHDEPEEVLATLSHEVAHAWRRSHGLEDDDELEEELLTDLAAVYLGFGVPVTNASETYRSSGELTGAVVTHRWSHKRSGYLPPQAFSYLLAVQSRCRREGSLARFGLASRLHANQRSFFRASLRALPKDAEALRAELGIDGSDDTPPDTVLDDTAPVTSPATTVHWERKVVREHVVDNAGRPVFRVPQSRLGGPRLLLILGGLVVVPAVVGYISHEGVLSLAVGIGAAVAGYVLGPRVRFEQCSDPRCEALLPSTATTCPKCGGTIRGTLARASDRLEAEEEQDEANPPRSGVGSA